MLVIELVARFQETRRCAPRRCWRPRAADEGGAVRNSRGRPWNGVGRTAHGHRIFYSCAPQVDWPHTYAFSPHTVRGQADAQHSQTVRLSNSQPAPSLCKAQLMSYWRMTT